MNRDGSVARSNFKTKAPSTSNEGEVVPRTIAEKLASGSSQTNPPPPHKKKWPKETFYCHKVRLTPRRTNFSTNCRVMLSNFSLESLGVLQYQRDGMAYQWTKQELQGRRLPCPQKKSCVKTATILQRLYRLLTLEKIHAKASSIVTSAQCQESSCCLPDTSHLASPSFTH